MTREGVEALHQPRWTQHLGMLRALGVCLAVLCSVFWLEGCSPSRAGRVVIAGRSVQVGGPHQSVRLSIPTPGAGLLAVEVHERGISVVAALDTPRGRGQDSASPLDRLGTITLVRRVTRNESVRIRIHSIDSPDISADVRIRAELLPLGSTRARARRLLGAADQATANRHWQVAFNRFLAASRLLRHLGLHTDVATAYQEMAELAYGYIQRDRDGIALVSATLTHPHTMAPATLGTRLVLLAKALMDLPGASRAEIRRAYTLLHDAAHAFRSSPLGVRELPRLTSIEGFLAYRAGALQRATQRFNRAAASCKRLGDWECFARARQNVASLAEEQQNYPTALSSYQQALRSLDTSRMPLLAADISFNLARLESQMGLFGRSEKDQQTAMRLYGQLGQCDHVRRSAASLGEMLVDVGSVNDAVTYLKQAATLTCPQLLSASRGIDIGPNTPISDSTSVAADFGGGGIYTGWLPHSSGPASICDRKTFNGGTQNDRIAVFQALLYLAKIAKADDNFDGAGACLGAARRYSFDDRTQVRIFNARGELQLARSDAQPAHRNFVHALRLAQSSALAQGTEYEGATEVNLAEADLALTRPLEAQRHARAALLLSSERADVTQVVAALRLLGLSFAASGKRTRGIRILRTAIGLIEQIPTGELNAAQRAMYLATQYSTFADLTSLLAGPTDTTGGPAWKAFAVAEQGHARTLRYAMSQAALDREAAPQHRESARYRALLRTLVASADHGPTVRSRELLNRLTQIALPTATVASRLDRSVLARQLHKLHATLVEYVVGHGSMLAFVTDGAVMHVFHLGSLTAISAASTTLSKRLQSPEQVPFEIHAAARALARLILWPIRSSLDHKRIIFVPDGTLYRIPLTILPWTSAKTSTLVLQHAEISEEPSALLLTQQPVGGAQADSRQRFVLIGDPVLRDNEWYQHCDGHPHEGFAFEVPHAIRTAFAWSRLLPTLPGTRTEVLAVSRIVHASRPFASVATFLGCAATASALRESAPHADVLHIATHGLVDGRRPRLSALALTPEAPSATHGAFRLLDILQLPLHARLVVLSACDTARGRVLPGEGVLGLAQAFLEAGAKSVVASYWLVQDAATVHFMESFYRHLLVDRMSVAAALRRTQLELAAHGSSYSWAAFGVYGRPDIHP